MANEGIAKRTTYQKWLDTEGLDVITDYMLDDVRTVPLKPWARKDCLGVHLCMAGAEDCDGAYICEIPAGGVVKPQKHLFEEMILILSGGPGKTEVWNPGGPKVTCNWQEGSLFAVPLNASHQHFNLGDTPVFQSLAVTGVPVQAEPAARAGMRILRQFLALKLQLPPRLTRYTPELGPAGSVKLSAG